MTTIIVPAHNEEAVVARSIESIRSNAGADSYHVILVANGCTDATAKVAKQAWSRIDVMETEVASKTHAMNLGEEKGSGFPRFYMDADIYLTPEAISTVASRMADEGALAAAPEMEMRFLNAPWSVRAYYRIWQQLPYVREGMIGVGVYALSEEGRRRFDRFPDIIADDGYIRRLFKPHERLCVADCRAIVTAPNSLWGLIKTKTRSRLGGYELVEKFPELSENEPKDYVGALWPLIRRPALWPSVLVYLAVNLIARLRARKMHRRRLHDVWERDESSRH